MVRATWPWVRSPARNKLSWLTPVRLRPTTRYRADRAGGADDQDDMNPSWSALDSPGNGPVLACAWDTL